jgi:hypothetical protein
MRLPLEGGGVYGSGDGDRVRVESAETARTEVLADRPDLLGPVLARVVGALAARRNLSVDRVSDAVLVTDAIADAAPSRFTDGKVRLGLEDRDGSIEVRLGPMDKGGAEEIRDELQVPDLGGSLEALVDGLDVDYADDGEYLLIRFAAAAAA